MHDNNDPTCDEITAVCRRICGDLRYGFRPDPLSRTLEVWLVHPVLDEVTKLQQFALWPELSGQASAETHGPNPPCQVL